jgi:hypothetical protein
VRHRVEPRALEATVNPEEESMERPPPRSRLFLAVSMLLMVTGTVEGAW